MECVSLYIDKDIWETMHSDGNHCRSFEEDQGGLENTDDAPVHWVLGRTRGPSAYILLGMKLLT